jgi:hypothetical protein
MKGGSRRWARPEQLSGRRRYRLVLPLAAARNAVLRGRSLILTNDYCLRYVRFGPDRDTAVAISEFTHLPVAIASPILTSLSDEDPAAQRPTDSTLPAAVRPEHREPRDWDPTAGPAGLPTSIIRRFSDQRGGSGPRSHLRQREHLTCRVGQGFSALRVARTERRGERPGCHPGALAIKKPGNLRENRALLQLHVPPCGQTRNSGQMTEREILVVVKWRRAGSNRQPPGCKPGALPIELRPPRKGTNPVPAVAFPVGWRYADTQHWHHAPPCSKIACSGRFG